MTAKEIVSQMSLEEKASLCSGKDFWRLKGIERLGLKEIMITDGPHGLRKQKESQDNLGIFDSVDATCFPASCASTCSFDRGLLREIGGAIAEECLAEKVATILGPAANIKRSPLCGRNFEYMSEDPCLTGETAAALISGIQGRGVGTSLKHYAANNQETRRMVSDSVIDERALREIYLAGFERAVKKAAPWTLMCSYNLVNGVYASENRKILTDILRDEWGFEGIVMSDWGAVTDRVNGIRAGLDLQMPGDGGANDKKIIAAVQNGSLDPAALDRAAVRLVEYIIKCQENIRDYRYDPASHHALARRAAAASAVLLKNEGELLPLPKGKTLAVLGAFAKTPRYQGAGSSKIKPHRIDEPLAELVKLGYKAEYAPGYTLGRDGLAADEGLIAEAASLAAKADIAIVYAGLPDEYESEGFDRKSIDMPESHNRLIEAAAAANPNTVVVLQCGAPVALPWAAKVKGILLLYLGGEAAGGAAADLLSGAVNPSGKLAETWPVSLKDNPSYRYFPGGSKTVEYRESIFTGYRYYEAAGVSPAFPFGHGLSYTSFEYSGLRLESEKFTPGGVLRLSVTVKNTGKTAGAEAVQIYVGKKNTKIPRPPKELRAFEKVFLQPGESRTLDFALCDRAFAYYNTAYQAWSVEGGEYEVYAAASSADVRLSAKVAVLGDGREEAIAGLAAKAPEYFAPKKALGKGEFTVPDASFAALYGKPLPPSERQPGEPFTLNSTLEEIKDHPIGQKLLAEFRQQMQAMSGDGGIGDMLNAMLAEMPLRSLGMFAGDKMPPEMLEALVDGLNGKPNPLLAGLAKM
jgi:beta-glucosidase